MLYLVVDKKSSAHEWYETNVLRKMLQGTKAKSVMWRSL